MTITLTPEIETAITEQAQKEGVAPEHLAMDGLRRLFVPENGSEAEVQQGIPLKDYQIAPEQATEIRAALASFAAEWGQPGMDAYDNYDAARRRLEAR